MVASGGRVRLVTPLTAREGDPYCLVAWIRGSPGTQPFLGVDVAPKVHHWVIGNAGYPDDWGGTAVAVSSDGKWHWYAAPFVLKGASQLDITDEIYTDGTAGTGDFDDIRLYAGACPAQPTGAPHDCP